MPGISYGEKTANILGGDYIFSLNIKEKLPINASYLIVSKTTIWFLNYYLFPRKLFFYPNISSESDIKSIPSKWLKDRDIQYIIIYNPPAVNLIKINGASNK